MKFLTIIILVTSVFFGMILSTPSKSEVTIIFEKKSPPSSIYLKGRISKRTYNEILDIENWFKEHNLKINAVFLNSLGGDIRSAMKIGRWIRKFRLTVVMYQGDRCASACIFLYAAGIMRMGASGRLLVHRPYSTDIDPNKDTKRDWDRKWKILKREARSYFEEMNVNPELVELMWRIPPSKTYELTEDDQDKYQLFFRDTSELDYERTVWAKKLGISRLELEQRLDRAGEVCNRDIDRNRFNTDNTYRIEIMNNKQLQSKIRKCRNKIVERGF